jgi:hypothetical protein
VRRQSTMLASAAAAALAALAVTVAVPALGAGEPPEADDFAACLREHGLENAPDGAALKPWLGERLEREDKGAMRALEACAPPGLGAPPAEKVDGELRECLVQHGARIEGEGPAAIKRWIAAHEDDPSARDAMKACDIAPFPGEPGVVCQSDKEPPPAPAAEGL